MLKIAFKDKKFISQKTENILRKEENTVTSIFVEPGCCEQAIVVIRSLWCVLVCACVCASIRLSLQIFPDQNFYIYEWISKQFGTVVVI